MAACSTAHVCCAHMSAVDHVVSSKHCNSLVSAMYSLNTLPPTQWLPTLVKPLNEWAPRDTAACMCPPILRTPASDSHDRAHCTVACASRTPVGHSQHAAGTTCSSDHYQLTARHQSCPGVSSSAFCRSSNHMMLHLLSSAPRERIAGNPPPIATPLYPLPPPPPSPAPLPLEGEK
jgi:hypothetical protein